MNSKEYVLNHNFGYGQKTESEKLNKLKLRNIDDLKVYVDDVLENCFINYKQGSLTLAESGSFFKIVISKA